VFPHRANLTEDSLAKPDFLAVEIYKLPAEIDTNVSMNKICEGDEGERVDVAVVLEKLFTLGKSYKNRDAQLNHYPPNDYQILCNRGLKAVCKEYLYRKVYPIDSNLWLIIVKMRHIFDGEFSAKSQVLLKNPFKLLVQEV
jgi:hypothetical protein